jgi:hypothetical protein
MKLILLFTSLFLSVLATTKTIHSILLNDNYADYSRNVLVGMMKAEESRGLKTCEVIYKLLYFSHSTSLWEENMEMIREVNENGLPADCDLERVEFLHEECRARWDRSI